MDPIGYWLKQRKVWRRGPPEPTSARIRSRLSPAYFNAEGQATKDTDTIAGLQIPLVIDGLGVATIDRRSKSESDSVAASLVSLTLHVDPFILMALIIVRNGLYRANKRQQSIVERRVQAHFLRKKLGEQIVKFTFMRLAQQKWCS
ncbi:hypothetical protein EDB86DRAFT_2828747 [Lactarius hatsudake]|nr:hypothetical protein EDB86DRAFT_2828747 [Lactarius hatsudake]